jgi:hypothetical protein
MCAELCRIFSHSAGRLGFIFGIVGCLLITHVAPMVTGREKNA